MIIEKIKNKIKPTIPPPHTVKAAHIIPTDLHAAGEKGLLVKDAFIVLHQVVELVSQLQRQGLQGGWLCAVHHQAGRGLIQRCLKRVTIPYVKNCNTLLLWSALGDS